jgi:hypothetical protein
LLAADFRVGVGRLARPRFAAVFFLRFFAPDGLFMLIPVALIFSPNASPRDVFRANR